MTSEEEWKESVDKWQKDVDAFIEELKKGEKKVSKELDKQLTQLQDRGKSLARDLKGEETVSEKVRDHLNDLGDQLVKAQEKLTRAWEELKK